MSNQQAYRTVDAQIGTTWENPELPSLNKLSSRSPLLPFPSSEVALVGAKDENPWVRSLDGDWSFNLYDKPADVPGAALATAATDKSTATLPVPGNWEFNGVTRHHYTNLKIPFPEEPPHVPAANPTGLYRKNVTIPASWEGRRILIEFDGVQGVLQVYLNGHFIGLSKDSMTTAAFDLTDQCKKGRNLLAFIVIKWSDARYVEDQDQWWTTGIFRTVRLVTTAPQFIRDVKATPSYNVARQSGSLDVQIPVYLGRKALEGYSVRGWLKDPSGKVVSPGNWSASVADDLGALVHWPRIGARLMLELHNVAAWTAETPNLYTLAVELLNEKGGILEAVTCQVGFRRIEIENRDLLVNGRRVLIRGINRHEFDPVHGKVQDETRIREDLLLLKRHHFNAIRTSHYPDTPRFYELCDELGFYVWDEANVEAHAFHNHLCHEPRYTRAFFERIENMVRRDKNHACIIAWSLGNESGYGPAHDASAGWIRSYDPSRPVHCEGAISLDQSRRQWTDGRSVTDIIGPMYARIHQLEKWAAESTDPRPMILSEYVHSMGNSDGSLSDYWEIFRACPGIQGGFIWEFCDHGILQHTDSGEPYFAYGGDFGDEPNDANFACSGIVNADRRPQPALLEAKHCQQPVAVDFTDIAENRIVIHSLQYFTNLDWMRAEWQLLEDGKLIAGEALPPLDLPPETARGFHLNLLDTAAFAGELVLQVRFFVQQTNRFFAADDVVAGAEHMLREHRSSEPIMATDANTRESEQALSLCFGGNQVTLDKKSGAIKEIEAADGIICDRPVELMVWRAPTDNDGIKLWTGQEIKDLGKWLAAGLDQLEWTLENLEIREDDDGECVETRRIGSSPQLERAFVWTQRIRVTGTDSLLIRNEVDCHNGLPNLPRLGERFALPTSFDRVRYYGRGPLENYPDRKSAAFLGIYESTVAEQYFPYAMPQENGNHCDTRWVQLRGALDFEFRFISQPCAFTTTHHDCYKVTQAVHTQDLETEPFTFLHLDYANAPIGSASVGPGPLQEYCIPPASYSWSYIIDLNSNQKD